ncbi:MAG: hypothetical protein Q8891_12335, partial [Bacteroidota bacterium]|nr:hypothetical protein [Bacteroidota bacterium]
MNNFYAKWLLMKMIIAVAGAFKKLPSFIVNLFSAKKSAVALVTLTGEAVNTACLPITGGIHTSAPANTFTTLPNDAKHSDASFFFIPNPGKHSTSTVHLFKHSVMKTYLRKSGLFAITLLMAGLFFIQNSFGQITTLKAWSNIYHGTSTSAQTSAYSVPTGSNTNRILVVAIASSQVSAGSRTVVLTYGTRPLTSVAGDMATGSILQHTQLYYLNEAGLDLATNTTLSVTVSGGTTVVTDVWAAVFDGVNQTSPITDFKTYNSGSSNIGSIAYSTPLNVNTNDQALEVISSVHLSTFAVHSINTPTNWALGDDQQWTTNYDVDNAVFNRDIPISNITDNSSTTFNNGTSGTTYGSMTGMTLHAAPIVVASPYTMLSSGTFTVPAGVSCIKVEAWGAGGDGGVGPNSQFGGRRGAGGGGSGAYIIDNAFSTTGNTQYTISIGNGGGSTGSGGSSNTTINTNLFVAAGGSSNTSNSSNGAAGGSSGNSVNPAGTGAPYIIAGTSGGNANGNDGGDGGTPFGYASNGGAGGIYFGTGAGDGTPPGGGGGGGARGSNGGNGAGGGVRFTWIDVSNFTVSASPTTICAGGTTDITLHSTSLANGDYNITYTTPANPGGVGTTVTFTSGVSTAFTVSGLTGPTSTVAITAITFASGSTCSTTLTNKSVVITVNAPTVGVGSALTAICKGGTTVALGGSYGGGATAAVWSDGLTGGQAGTFTNNGGTTPGTATYTASASAPASVTLTLTTSGGSCGTTSASKTLTVNPSPTITLGTISPICAGSMSFTIPYSSPAGSPNQYSISGAGITTVTNGTLLGSPITVSLSAGASGTSIPFTLTVRNSSGCVSSNIPGSVTVNPAPTVTCPGNSSVCIDASPFTLTGGSPAGGTYSGTGVSAGTFNPATAGAGSHTITYTYINGSGCSNSCSFTITVNPLPVVSISNLASQYCTNSPAVTITGIPTGSGGSFIAYDGGSPDGGITDNGNGTATFNPSTVVGSSSTIVYTYTDGNGCTNYATPDVTINPAPTASEVHTDLTCNGAANGTATITGAGGTGPLSYTLSGGTLGSPSTNATGSFTGLGAGIYNYTVTDANSCSATAGSLTIMQPAAISITSATVTSPITCNGGTGTVTITATGGT